MDRYTTIKTNDRNAFGTVTLDRPGVHNAMNIRMIRELAHALEDLGKRSGKHLILIDAAGPNFSAGADLHWMREGIGQDRDQLLAESKELAGLFRQISESGSVIVTAVRGKAIGGAVGLVAASDLVIAESSASFRFSEVKLGLIPAVIAPYVLRKTGTGKAAAWMLTGREFPANEAHESGLVQFICPPGGLEEETSGLLKELRTGGPAAIAGIKQLIRKVSGTSPPAEYLEETADLIAAFRTSKEGQEGIRAFFEKRNPDWTDG